MPDRRDFLIGGLGVAALGTAEFLRPRKSIRLFSGMKLEDAVPQNFGRWREHPGGKVLAPTTPGSLADRLYSATVSRIYYPTDDSGPPVMFLAAYGGEQSDLLQLHRPESCYPAVGYRIAERRFGTVPLVGAANVPAVLLSAEGDSHLEDIVYWTRLGEAMPRTAEEQRSDRLAAAMRGVVGDGILVRASTVRWTQEPGWNYLASFLGEIIRALPAKARPGFVGTERAAALA